MDQHQVGLWRKRFLADRLDGLNDQPRSGRPRRLGHDQRLQIAAVATSERDPDDPIATWTYIEVTEAMNEAGIDVSVSQVWRILHAMDIDLSKVRGWLNRRDDPDFWVRVRDVCRKYPDQPPRQGRLRRREFEYVRHGTASLFAALDVHTGEVLAEPIHGKNNSINFCGFLDDIERAVDPALAIHVVLDNGSSHVSKHTRAWFDAHPRWHVHYTPPHASWANQVELFFSVLQRKVINNGDFASRDDLISKMLRFIADYDQTARPFKWTYAADPLVA